MKEDEEKVQPEAFVPRGYQLEMLEASMKGNMIIAMDTGSGKTPIAVLRIAAELERCSASKRVWFLCPKVALAQQQSRVVQRLLPAALCKVLVGSDGCEYWSTQAIWDEALLNVQVVVCTPEILRHALAHGFVSITEIALLIFDEAHYCKDNHPSNLILTGYYHPARIQGEDVPHILGLTASPVFGNEVSGLRTIEKNMDSMCRTPQLNRDELLRYTHRPVLIQRSFKEVAMPKPDILVHLEQNYHMQSIYDDPWIKQLQADDKTSQAYLSKMILKGKTNCRDQIRTLIEAANKINSELGPWASEWYLLYCMESFRDKRLEELFYVESLEQEELAYLLTFFEKLVLTEQYSLGSPTAENVSPKVNLLVEIILEEFQPGNEIPTHLEATHTALTGIVFVETRIAVCVLKRLLEHHPLLKEYLRLGLSFGTSTNAKRKRLMCDCVMNDKSIEDLEDVLDDLRTGKKNLLISTNVVEEGIDITACNTIICFNQPPNLVSFVQRRGRARHIKSKYFIMFPETQIGSGVAMWQRLEEEMKEKYKDHMRELERLENWELSQSESRTYHVESTGARMILMDAMPHLNHFCSILGDVRYASNKPVYICDASINGESMICEVILPSCVDNSFRRFRSSKYWPSEKLAKADAALEACIALHKAGLLNDNLLPIRRLPEEEASMYQTLEKRPNVVEVLKEYDPWPSVARLVSNTHEYLQRCVTIEEGNETRFAMQLIMPGMPEAIQSFDLHIDDSTALHVSLGDLEQVEPERIPDAVQFTKAMLYSIFKSRMDLKESILPILFLPLEELHGSWISNESSGRPVTDLLSEDGSIQDTVLLRDANGNPHLFLGMESVKLMSEELGGQSDVIKTMIKASRLSKRTDFLHPLSARDQPKKLTPIHLDPGLCNIDPLPFRFARFGTFVPSIQRKIRNSLLVERLKQTILEPTGLSSTDLILEAISAPAAREETNYQRMEFLGDAILKYYTVVTLMAQNLTFPEGYLAYTKDLIVSNKSAALAAKETGLDEFIIRAAFTGARWRPVYIRDLDSALPESHEDEFAELSTKVLADVVEALIGAAYLDYPEPEPKVIAILEILTSSVARSKIKWQPLASLQQILISAAPEIKHVPDAVIRLQTMIGYSFNHPSLAVEALTHPGHISLSSSIATGSASYQRLEFLGDAVLDMVVTRIIYSFKKPTPVSRMHLLRTAAVNQDILGYFALRLKIDVETSELVKNVTTSGQKRDRESRIRNQPDTLPLRVLRSVTLPQLLRVSPTPQLSQDLADMQKRWTELDRDLKNALETGKDYPWVLLTLLAPEKLASDLIEAVIGAIYIDSHGNLDVCEAWIDKLGIIPWLRRALEEDVKVWHPKEELGVLADTEKVKYSLRRDDDQQLLVCTVVVGDKEICEAQGQSRKIAETKAAAAAIEILSKDKFIDSIQESMAIEEVRGEVEVVDLDI